MNINQLVDDVLYSVVVDAARARSVIMLGREIKDEDLSCFYTADEGVAPPSDHVRVCAKHKSFLVWKDPTRPELRAVCIPPALEPPAPEPDSSPADGMPVDTPINVAIAGSSKALRKLNLS